MFARLWAVGQVMQVKKYSVRLETLASTSALIGPIQAIGLAGGFDYNIPLGKATPLRDTRKRMRRPAL